VVTRWALLGVAVLAILLAVGPARPQSVPGPFLRDFESYWSAGATWNSGGNPYGRAIWRTERRIAGVDAGHDELLPFVAPPSTLLLFGLLARLPYGAAAAAWLAMLAIALLALVTGALWLARTRVTVMPFLGALLLAASFGPITSDTALGQMALPAFAAAVFTVLLAGVWGFPSALLACAAFSQPNVAIGLVSQLGRNRASVAIAIGAMLAVAIGAVAWGLTWPLEYLAVLAAHGAAERFVAIQFTPAAIAYGFGTGIAGATAVALACALATTALAVVIWRRVPDRFARFAAFSALLPFVTTFFHEHDLVVAYPAVIWCSLRTRNGLRALALAATLLAGIDWLGMAQRPTGIAQIVLLAVAVAAAFGALGEPSLNQLAPAIIAMALLLGAAALAAHAHPLPVWPDALGRFHASPHANAATVWLEEQRTNGLLAPSPVWAALRALPLLGCGLLAYLIYRRCAGYRTA